MKRETGCAIVVTFNRKDLLLKCLESLRNQTKSLDAIYIIDNASIDGTPELLKEDEYNISKNKIYFFAITFMYYFMLNVSAILRRDFRAIVLYFFALVDGLSGRFGREKMILRRMSSQKK
ncbi:MAG: glycosyltransferase [Candidatus Woesearchaeota archaeon]